MATSTAVPKDAQAGLVIGFDADDTLWHNEIYYRQAAERFRALLGAYQAPEQIEKTLSEFEVRNISLYGYGFKSFTLSMIEAAIAITARQAPAELIDSILQIGRGMLNGEVLLFEHARDTLRRLADDHVLMLITKGDLLEQGNKVRRSGLAGFFRYIEIVEDKTPESYRALLDKYAIPARRFLMVGNSLKSDILPVLEIGGRAIFVPYEHTWAHEHADGRGRSHHEIEHLGQLPSLIASLDA